MAPSPWGPVLPACSGIERTSRPPLYGALTLAEGLGQRPSHTSAQVELPCKVLAIRRTSAQEALAPPQSWVPSFTLHLEQPPDQAGGPWHPVPVRGSPWPWGGCGAEAGSAGVHGGLF